MSGPWVEKYRPQNLDDIIGQKQIVNRLQKYVGEESMPNLMFTGPAGVGKTTTAIALVMETKLFRIKCIRCKRNRYCKK